MKSTFSEFYKPSDDELKALWGESLFVIDANVLINLYRYPISARDDLLKTLSAIGDRLWMPFQAAYEYQRRRLDVIDEQKRAFEAVKSELESAVKKIEGIFSARHPLISSGTLVEDLQGRISSYASELMPLSDRQPDVHHQDEIRDKIDALLMGKIGPEPTAEYAEQVCKEGVERFLNKIPPGFMDAKKEDHFHFRGFRYEAKYGDLLLWKQTIDHAKTNGWKSVIFITDDKKEDWWLKVSGKIIGPLPSLKAEIGKAGVSNFHMYTTESFLYFSSNFQKSDISPSSIKQVAKVNEAVNQHIYFSGDDREPVVFDSYFVVVNRNLNEVGRIELFDKITRTIKTIFPAGDFHLRERGAELEVIVPANKYSADISVRLLSMVGVDDVVPFSGQSEHSKRTRMLDDQEAGLNYSRFYELAIRFDPSTDARAITVAQNWLKMRLNKDFPSGEFGGVQTFAVRSVGNVVNVNIHVPVERRVLRQLVSLISDLEDVSEVNVRENRA